MSDNEHKEVDLNSQTFENRSILEEVKDCVCVNCLKEFKVDEVADWLDDEQTAACPHCFVDAVLPKTETLTKEKLKELHYLWFTPIFHNENDGETPAEANSTEEKNSKQ